MEEFFKFFNSPALLGLFIKLFGVVIGFIYLLFAGIMIRQVSSMKEAVNIKDQGALRLAAFIQLGFAVLVVFYALVVL